MPATQRGAQHASDAAEPESSWTFVEVSVGHEVCRTETVYTRRGEAAMWHSDVKVPLVAAEPALKAPAATVAHIRVYDEVLRHHGVREHGAQIHHCHTVTRRLLASAQVAISAVAQLQPMDAQAPLQPVRAMLGYTPSNVAPYITFAARLQGAPAAAEKPPFITADGERFIRTREPSLAARERAWRSECMTGEVAERAKKPVYGLVCGLDGSGVALTRFVAPAMPPPAALQQISRLERHVSHAQVITAA